MARKQVTGICHICGNNGKLSFEHVPPRSAFNKRPIVLRSGEELINSNLEDAQGETRQRGAGGYTLCPRCNNFTGRWYGNAFVEWVYQGMNILHYTQGRPSIYYTFHIFPLRIMKQIVSMFFSANGPRFRDANPELIKFVLNKNTYGMDKKYRIYAYYNLGVRSRQVGLSSRADFKRGTINVMSEIAYPPIGYMMTFSSPPPDPRLLDITFMSRYRYNDWKSISLRLPILPVYTYLPADYRDRDTVIRQRAENIET